MIIEILNTITANLTPLVKHCMFIGKNTSGTSVACFQFSGKIYIDNSFS